MAYSPPGFAPPHFQTFTANGNWVRRAGVDAVLVRAYGSGGGGGGAVASAGTFAFGGGGGAGGYREEWVDVTGTAVGANIAVTIGASAAGGSAAGSNGVVGNATTFGALLQADGGGAGGGSAGASGGA